MNIAPKDIRIEYFKSSGPGGQHKNKRFTAVKAVHIPTGIFCVASEQRSQLQNKQTALKRLLEKLERLTRKKKARIPTAIPRGVKERILEVKKKRSQKKLLRKRVRLDEE
jgi:protein subunit release factor A